MLWKREGRGKRTKLTSQFGLLGFFLVDAFSQDGGVFVLVVVMFLSVRKSFSQVGDFNFFLSFFIGDVET